MRTAVLCSFAALMLLTWPATAQEAPPKAPPAEDGLLTPEAGTPEWIILDGLRLIADGKFDAWVKRYCHKDKLCRSKQATKSIKQYNLKAASRLVGYCLKGEKKDKLKITRRVEKGEELKLFLACNVNGMPRPFTLQKEAGEWKFRRI